MKLNLILPIALSAMLAACGVEMPNEQEITQAAISKYKSQGYTVTQLKTTDFRCKKRTDYSVYCEFTINFSGNLFDGVMKTANRSEQMVFLKYSNSLWKAEFQ